LGLLKTTLTSSVLVLGCTTSALAANWGNVLGAALDTLNEVQRDPSQTGAKLLNQLEKKSSSSSLKADKSALSQGIYIDPQTNLNWYRCPAPATWNGSNCVGTPNVPMRYDEALRMVNELNTQKYGGYSDWRIPSLDETLVMFYGTSDQSAEVNRSKINGVNLLRFVYAPIASTEAGCADDPLCNFGSMWTSTQVQTKGQGLSLAVLDIDSTDLKGWPVYPTDTAKVGGGIVYGSYKNGLSSFYPLLRLVRGGGAVDTNGEKALAASQQKINQMEAKYQSDYAAAEKQAEQCKETENAKWRKNIRAGEIIADGGIVAKVAAGQVLVQYADANGNNVKYKTFVGSQVDSLENLMINSGCMKSQIDVFKNKEQY